MKEIQLGGRHKSKISGYTLVDDEGFEELNKYHWSITAGYAKRSVWSKEKMESIYMHRVIMDTPKGMYTDHIDGNPLNNQKSNLRICTHSQNIQNSRMAKNNTTGFRGVALHKKSKKYWARIKIDRESRYLGTFNSPEEAALAYNEVAKKYFGEFANTN